MASLLQEKRTVIIDEQKRRITLEEIVYRALIAKASKGDSRSLKIISDLVTQEERNATLPENKTVRLIMVRPDDTKTDT